MSTINTAITGLQAAQQWLDVIANNVSNSETVGYKESRVTFSDLISEGLSSSSSSDSGSNLGGVDGNQVGLGVTVSSIQNIFTQGSLETTGNATDVAISGNGFFTVEKGDQTLYTRAGNFTFDSNGNLVTSDGGLVEGWSATYTQTNDAVAPARINASSYTLNTSDVSKIGAINIPSDLTIAPEATSAELSSADTTKGVVVTGNLDAKTPPNTNAALLNTAGLVTGGATAPLAAGASAAAYSNPAVPGAVTIATVNALTGVNDPFTQMTADATTSSIVYDSEGTPHTITTEYFQVGDTTSTPFANSPQWAWYSFDTTVVSGSAIYTGTPSAANCIGGSGINTAAEYVAGDVDAPTSAYGLISFNADGSLQTNGGCSNVAATVQTNPVLMINNELGATSAAAGLLDDGSNSDKFSLNFGTADTFTNAGSSVTQGGFNQLITTNGERNGLTGNYGSGTTSSSTGVYTPNQTVTSTTADGYSSGTLTTVSISDTGQINGTFSNSKTIVLAQLALASFNNDSGLTKSGSSYYTVSANSGDAVYGTAGSNGLGSTTGGALEASNVDLTTELTNMIVAQRMFEANARVVTTASSVLSDLVDLGR
jgi:flagellar hook protein FlgE